MQPSARDRIPHVTAEFPVGSAGIHTCPACPFPEGVHFSARIHISDPVAVRIALAQDQSFPGKNIFSIAFILLIKLLCNIGQPFLFFCDGCPPEDPIISAAEAMFLVSGKVLILRDFLIIRTDMPGNPLHN